jgi:hypothetical protein
VARYSENRYFGYLENSVDNTEISR